MESGGQRRELIGSPIARSGFNRRSATKGFGGMADRGLKPTATFDGRSATKDKNQRVARAGGCANHGLDVGRGGGGHQSNIASHDEQHQCSCAPGGN